MARKNRRMGVLKRQREQKKAERTQTKAIRKRERRDGIESGAISGSSDTTVEDPPEDSEFGESPDGSPEDGTD